MTWFLDQESRQARHLLLSLGNDGKVLLWEHVVGQRELRLLRGYRLLTESIPRSLRVSKAKGEDEIGGGLVVWWIYLYEHFYMVSAH